jgi:hypothetical protein
MLTFRATSAAISGSVRHRDQLVAATADERRLMASGFANAVGFPWLPELVAQGALKQSASAVERAVLAIAWFCLSYTCQGKEVIQMCLDPHAVAILQVREALENIECYLHRLAADNTDVSAAVSRLAVLKHQVDRCSGCYSRRRSKRLLAWVIREAAELVVRVTETLPRIFSVAFWPQWRTYELGRSHSSSSNCGWLFSKGVRRAA